MTFSPLPTTIPTTRYPVNNVLAFNQSCTFVYWQVPVGVNNVTVYAWGAGGTKGYNSASGGSGAFVQAAAYVTAGETLRVGVGGHGASATCGFAGVGGSSAHGFGGGHTSLSRFPVIGNDWVYMLVAGGGGEGTYTGTGGPGKLINPTGPNGTGGCGLFDPNGTTTSDPISGGGGGGWIGGTGGPYVIASGGTSCCPLCINTTVSSTSGDIGSAANVNCPYYASGYGSANENGLLVLTWFGPNASPSSSAAVTLTPTPSPTLAASPSLTVTRTANGTASITATASVSPYCNPIVFVTFASSDMVGTTVGTAMVVSERDCQRACCSAAACTGYTFNSMQITLGGSFAMCIMLANVTQVVPNHAFSGGVLASVYAS